MAKESTPFLNLPIKDKSKILSTELKFKTGSSILTILYSKPLSWLQKEKSNKLANVSGFETLNGGKETVLDNVFTFIISTSGYKILIGVLERNGLRVSLKLYTESSFSIYQKTESLLKLLAKISVEQLPNDPVKFVTEHAIVNIYSKTIFYYCNSVLKVKYGAKESSSILYKYLSIML